MKINFVTEPANSKWILRRWCEEWAKYLPNSKVDTGVDIDADVNIFCNYALYFPAITKRISIFTHRELEDEELQLKFDIAAENSDWCFAQSIPTFNKLPAGKSSILRPSVGAHFFKPGKPIIGIVGRGYPSGRKNFHWIEELQKLEGIQLVWTDSQIPYENMHEFYDKIDYLLITANNEGGPMPVVEALAMHKPVIAPNGVGWCDEFSCIKYDGTLENLITVLEGLLVPRNGWETGANHIYEICERLVNGHSSRVH